MAASDDGINVEDRQVPARIPLSDLNSGLIVFGPDKGFEFANEYACQHLGDEKVDDLAVRVPHVGELFIDPNVADKLLLSKKASIQLNQVELRGSKGSIVSCKLHARHVDRGKLKGYWLLTITTGQTKPIDMDDFAERFQPLADVMHDGFAVRDADNRLTYVNERFCEILGYTSKELVGRQVERFLDPSSEGSFADEMKKRNAGEAGAYRVCWRRKDKSRAYTLVNASPFLDAKNGSFATMTDITDLQVAKDELEKTKSVLTLLVDSLPGMAYHFVSDDGHDRWMPRMVSAGCYQLTGYTPEEFLHESDLYEKLVDKDDWTNVSTTVRMAADRDAPFHVSYWLRDRHDRSLFVWEAGRNKKVDGRGLSRVGFISDFRGREALEKEKHDRRIEQDSDLLSQMQEDSIYQDKWMFWVCITVGFLGFVAMLAGGAIALSSEGSTGLKTAGWLGAAGGALAQFITAVMFVLQGRTQAHLERHEHDLRRRRRFNIAMSECSQLPSPRRDQLSEKIIDWFLSDQAAAQLEKDE